MVYPAVFLIHSATLNGRRQNFTLGYDAGTAAFTAGATLTGAASGATAVIVSVSGTAVSGVLTLHTITGTFANDEPMTDNGTVPGAAKVNGTVEEAFDINGELSYTILSSEVACRFAPGSTVVRDGQVIIVSPSVVLPPTASPMMGDTLTSTETGFNGTFTFSAVPEPTYEAAQKIISHWMCDIAKAGA